MTLSGRGRFRDLGFHTPELYLVIRNRRIGHRNVPEMSFPGNGEEIILREPGSLLNSHFRPAC